LGHRETTTKAGLKWLVAGGRISILETSGDILTVADGGVPSPDLQRVESRLRQMLEETAAYRRHFCTAPVEMLGLD
jgi:hypothetical protein